MSAANPPPDKTQMQPLGVAVWQHPVTRIAVYVALFVLSLIVASAAVKPASPYIRRHSDLADPINSLVPAILAVGALALIVKVVERRRMRDAGFTVRGVVTETITGAMIGMAMISVVIGITAACGVYHPLSLNHHFLPWVPLVAFFFGAVFEETAFRGFIFRVVEYRWGSLAALIVSSLIFGLLHILNEVHAHIPLIQKLIGPVFICLEAGLLLGAAYMATRRLWLPIGIHWAWNYFEGPVYGTDVSGTGDNKNVLIHSSLQGPFLLSGGTFGPEGSIICAVVGLIFGFLLLRVAVRAGHWKPAGEWKPQSEPRSVASG